MKTICLSPRTFHLASAEDTIVMQPFHCGMSMPFERFEAKGVRLARQISCDEPDFRARAERAWALYCKTADRLVRLLNAFHHEDRSPRYWETLFWRHLYPFICTIVDKHDRLEAAVSDIDEAIVFLPPELRAQNIPLEKMGFGKNEDAHLVVYAMLVPLFPELQIKKIPADQYLGAIAMGRTGKGDSGSSGKNALFKSVRAAAKFMVEANRRSLPADMIKSTAKNHVFLGAQYLSVEDKSRLLRSLGEKPFSFYFKELKPSGRKSPKPSDLVLDTDPDDTALEKLIMEKVFDFLPGHLFEDYQQYRGYAAKLVGNKAYVILNSWENVGREERDFFIAESVERNGSVSLMPCHGGCYGAMEISLVERVWARICDHHCIWGDRIEAYGNHSVKLPGLRLFRHKKHPVTPNNTGDIVYFFNGYYPNTYQFESITPYYTPDYPQQFHRLFTETLDQHIAEKLKIRDFHKSLDEMPHFAGQLRATGAEIAPRAETFMQALQNARISVHTAPQTTYIELLVMNYPSLCVWEPDRNLIRRELLPYFDDLKKVGIIHHDPVTAAQTLNDIYDDVDAWWNEPERQAAVSNFVSHVCFSAQDTIDIWADFLKKSCSQLQVEL